MGIFDRFRRGSVEKRSDVNESEPTVSLLRLLDGVTGVLTREAALEIPSVSANIEKLAATVSQLPVKLYRKDDGKVRRSPMIRGSGS